MDTYVNVLEEVSNLFETGSLNIPSIDELKAEINLFSKHLFIDSSSLFNYAYLCHYLNALKSNFNIYINVFYSSSAQSLPQPSPQWESQLLIKTKLNFYFKNILVAFQLNSGSLKVNEYDSFSLYQGEINPIGVIEQKVLISKNGKSSHINDILNDKDIGNNLINNLITPNPNHTLYLITQSNNNYISSETNTMSNIIFLFFPEIAHITPEYISNIIKAQTVTKAQIDYSEFILKEYLPKIQSKPFSSYFYIEQFSKHDLFFGLRANVLIGQDDNEVDLLTQKCTQLIRQSKFSKTMRLRKHDSICLEAFMDDLLTNAIGEYNYYLKLMKTVRLTIDDSLNMTLVTKDNESKYKSIHEINSIKNIVLTMNKAEISKFHVFFPEQIELLIEEIKAKYEQSSTEIKSTYSDIIIPTSEDIDKIVQAYSQLIKELKAKTEESIGKTKDFEEAIITTMKNYLADCGISSANFDKMIVNNKPQEDIACSLESLFTNESQLEKALQSLGVSATTGVVSGLASFGITRLIAIIGTDALVGSSGGPIGTIIGIVIGIGSFIGQSIYYYLKNKKKIKLVHKDLETASNICTQLLIQKIKDFAETNKKEMESLLEEINIFSQILISHGYKLDKAI